MKEIHLIAAVSLLLVSCDNPTPSPTPFAFPVSEQTGRVLNADCSSITGWARWLPGSTVRAYSDGYSDQGVLIGMDTPSEDRTEDLFLFEIPMIEPLRDGKTHRIRAFSSTSSDSRELDGSPQTINCPPPMPITDVNGVIRIGSQDRVGLRNDTDMDICFGRSERNDQNPDLMKEAQQASMQGGKIAPGQYRLSEDPGNLIGWTPC